MHPKDIFCLAQYLSIFWQFEITEKQGDFKTSVLLPSLENAKTFSTLSTQSEMQQH